jgi:pSer/pThr/pTyr-binding forkhead associated (FHA) protein
MAELILSLRDRELSRHALGAVTRVGRDPDCEVFIDNVGVSRHHATITQQGASYAIHDEGSANGVYVNGLQVATHPLADGDVVQIGKFSLRLNLVGTGVPLPGQESRSLSPPARDMAKTFHLEPNEVQRLVTEQRMTRSGSSADGEPDHSMRILGIGLLVITVLSVISYLVLIR